MARTFWLIGIGTGNPDHVTVEGLKALQQAALILMPHKGDDKAELVAVRQRIIEASGTKAKIVPFDYPVRDPALPYLQRVAVWHDAIAARWQQALDDCGDQVAADGPVALLVWGDPALYDSTLRIADRLVPRPDIRVIPGITALQALTAAHALPFNTVGGAVTVTTGRRLRTTGWPAGAESVAVMLDGQAAFQYLDPDGLHILWGAYLGMAAQILDSGPLIDAGPRIVAARQQARARQGWIMDSYLLRRVMEQAADD